MSDIETFTSILEQIHENEDFSRLSDHHTWFVQTTNDDFLDASKWIVVTHVSAANKLCTRLIRDRRGRPDFETMAKKLLNAYES